MGNKNTKTKKIDETKLTIYEFMLKEKSGISSEEKIESIARIQRDDEKIEVNVSGDIFIISKQQIIESKYKNSFFNDIVKEKKTKVFVDREPKNFETILQILRFSSEKLYFTKKVKEQKNRLFHNFLQISKNDPFLVYLQNDLKFYFKPDYEEVLKDFNLSEIFNEKEINNKLTEIRVVDVYEDQKLHYMNYLARDIDDIKNTFSRKAFFCNEKGYIVIYLSSVENLRKIQFRCFTFDKDIYDYTVEDDVKIYTSYEYDQETWCLQGTVSLNHQNEIEHIYELSIPDTRAKFIKFKPKYSPFSLNYLSIFS